MKTNDTVSSFSQQAIPIVPRGISIPAVASPMKCMILGRLGMH
jgi:hypothetical protein